VDGPAFPKIFVLENVHLPVELVVIIRLREFLNDFSQGGLFLMLGFRLSNISRISLDKITTTIIRVITVEFLNVLGILSIFLLINARGNRFPKMTARTTNLQLRQI
jgi:hypothetical protein